MDPRLLIGLLSLGASLTTLLGILSAFTIAALVAFFLTPLIAHLAIRVGAIDRPDGRRKSQIQPVPRGGGIAVALAALVGVSAVIGFLSLAEDSSSTLLLRGLLPALSILLVVGIVDDVWTLTGIYKLMGQVFAVSVLVAGGTQFDRVSLFGYLLPLGDMRIPFTIFFCLGAINAFNLIDGADALASSLGAVICIALGIITASRGEVSACLVCFALAGALIGFLRHNASPARVYLGDTGSMLIGLVVATVAIDCSLKQQAVFALVVPLALCAIPILDVVAALIRRVITGQSVFTPDRGHLHHALLLRGWSVNKTVMIITGLAALTCGGALVSYFTKNDLYAVAVASGVFAMLAFARIFGHIEARLIASRSMSLAQGVLSRGAMRRAPEVESAVQLQGSRKWHSIWAALREVAPVYNITGLTLQIGMPQLHESFFANWKSKEVTPTSEAWRMTLPLKLEDQPIGKLTLTGSSGGRQALADMQQILDFLEPLHERIAELANGENQITEETRGETKTTHSFDLGPAGAMKPVTGILN